MLAALSDMLWSPPVILLFMLCGGYCTVKTRLLSLRPWRWMPLLLRRDGGDGSLPPWKAAITSAGGSLGTGNIVGVAWAIKAGGPGALLWIWVSALLGAGLSYCEKYLTILTKHHGKRFGAISYVETALGKLWGKYYAVLAFVSVTTGGCMIQSSAIADGFSASLRPFVAVAMTGLTFFIVRGGLKSVSDSIVFLVPIVAAAYLAAGGYTLYMYRAALPSVLRCVFRSGLSFRAAFGGTLCAMRCGYARGVFSGEAGVGISTLPHSTSTASDPGVQGAWGILEVLISTVFFCTVTALVILCAPCSQIGAAGQSLTVISFQPALGKIAPMFVNFCIFILAFSTILSRYCCGQLCAEFFGIADKTFFRFAFCLCFLTGVLLPSELLWSLSDIITALLSVPNLVSLVLLQRKNIASVSPMW